MVKLILDKIYKKSELILTIALSILESLILILLNNKLRTYNEEIDLYLVSIPIIILILINWTSNKNIFKSENGGMIYKSYFKNSFVSTIFIYLFSILINFDMTNRIIKISIVFFCLGTIYLLANHNNPKECNDIEESLSDKNKNEFKLFNIYYVNISKVFEIAMLINNKIATAIEQERTIERREDINEELSKDINLEYLKSIKNGISFKDTYTESNSTKNKVLENFEVKTTKSNLLESIIRKTKEYANGMEINSGDLLLFKNVKLRLKNEEDTMEITRMLVNGAFNGSNISSTSEDMKMDLNMSALINSMLKDCSYELECSVEGLNFCIKIPMSLKNDFESNYNIYDILIGKMNLIGIYRGEDKEHKYKNALNFFNNEPQKKDSGLKKSATNKDYDFSESKENSNNDCINYVDVIAIIKEININ